MWCDSLSMNDNRMEMTEKLKGKAENANDLYWASFLFILWLEWKESLIDI